MHFKFDGGVASDGMLDIYDASVALRVFHDHWSSSRTHFSMMEK